MLGDIYYWPSDGHAADHSPSSGDVLEPVVVSSSDHGTATADSVASGTMSTLHMTPYAGYEVSSVTIKDIDGNDVEVVENENGSTEFKMPYGGVTIWVTYKYIGNPTPTPDPNPEPEPDPDQDVEIPETEGGAVEVAPVPTGETATVVAKPDAGQEVRDVIVTDSEGNEVETSVDEDGNVTFEMPEGGATVEVVFGCDGGDLCVAHKFSDVTHDDWFHDTVDWALDNGIFHGYNDTSFAPNDTLTREQAATVMYNYFGGAAGSPGSGLPDVEGDEWYTDAVNWAVENSIMTGYSDSGEFGIGNGLSREQFCTVIVKAMGADLSDVDLSVLDRFTDADSVSYWAKPAVAWAVQNGLMNGVENPDGTRSLQGIRDMTRAEMATMMKNAVDAGVLTK
nr:S-layer homology domain-containing protein [Collinsella tanakaei]